ncbi:MAG: SLBB domain-containing protein [Muribaculaceae bacterium]|nr:SLBB domain-containing protein [Muribaculaceae bacterium]
MTKKLLRSIVVAFALSLTIGVAYARMTDQQVIDYVQKATDNGKSQNDIIRELMARGVTEAQLRRIKQRVEQQNKEGVQNGSTVDRTVNRNSSANTNLRGNSYGYDNSQMYPSRNRNSNSNSGNYNNQKNQNSSLNNYNKNNKNQNQNTGYNNRNGNNYNNQYNNQYNRNGQNNRRIVNGTEVIVDEEFYFEDEYDQYWSQFDENYTPTDETKIYGVDIFRSRDLTFEPNENLATPADYRLGPGDEVIIDVWGNNEAQIRESISPEGSIFVEQIGPIYLSGLTIKEANDRIKNIFSQKYADVADRGSDIVLSLGQLRSIQVDVMGEVSLPGTYRISPFSTLFHALYNAGGTTDSGSLRQIEILRNGRRVATADIYDYIFNGKRSNDIRLQEGDVIVVPAYDRLVTIEGEVKRPMIYELKKGETVADLLEFSGGLKSSARGDRVTIDRTINGAKTVAVVEATDFETSRLDDGDIVTIGKADERYDNRVEVDGAIVHPGAYAIGIDVNTVGDLVKIAGNPTEDAFLSRVQLFRENPDRSTSVIGVNLGGILKGTVPDVQLQKNDVLIISSVDELEPKEDVTIEGEVNRPGEYPFAKGMTIEDLIVQAGGMKEGASIVKVDISRRLKSDDAMTISEKIGKNFTMKVKDGLIVDGEKGFELEPGDIVDIRRSPGYVEQRRVKISGEVPFEGQYSLGKRTERISDLVNRAGGVSQFAYLKGAHLTRQLTEDEKIARDETLSLARMSGDSIASNKLIVSDTYTVGIDLDKALSNPGGPEDLVLMEGDELVIPELVNTVKISGEVLFPNTVIYTPGKKYKYYVNQAGGWGNTANKSRAFVVYMNGQVARADKAVIEPGCQIIVPAKEKKEGMSVAQWMAIGSSAASLGTMAATIASVIKK